MNIVIYGTGAIGAAIATFLKKSSFSDIHNIILIGRKKIIESINKNGLIYVPYGAKQDLEYIKTDGFEVHENISELDSADVIFLTMKAHALRSSLESAKKLIKKSNPVIIITMNGLGLKEIVKEYSDESKIIETTAMYPSKITENKVINTGGNAFVVSEDTEIARTTFGKIFSENSLDLRYDSNFQNTLWMKAMMNVGMNAITAITSMTVGQVCATETLKKIIEKVLSEFFSIAEKEGVNFGKNMVPVFWDFCGKDPNHRPSMQQDISNAKLTEIDFLNTYISNKGRIFEIPTPGNDAIVNLIYILENREK